MKRAFYLILTLATAFLWLPLLVCIAVLVRVRLGSPIFFKQQRTGLGGELFTLIKFRSMRDDRDREGNLLPDSNRLTPFGCWLRSTSLDELPELFHVVRGQMSLVGPRPLLPQYLDRYSPRQARRHEVLPGVTGWAQINGRDTLSWEERFELDVWYVDNKSFFLDLRILARTFINVITRRDVHPEKASTMPEFMGQNQQPR